MRSPSSKVRQWLMPTSIVAASLLVSSCTDVPSPTGYPLTSTEKKLASIDHWKRVATDVGKTLFPTPKVPPDPTCIEIDSGMPDKQSDFQNFLVDAIATNLVERSDIPKVVKTIGEKCAAGGSHISIENVQVYQHHPERERPLPGPYTVLASGIVVVRHVVKHFSEASLVGAVAGGELAYWATSGLGMKPTGVEVAVTVSMTVNDTYLQRFTNTYYISGDDCRLYASPTDSKSCPIQLSEQDSAHGKSSDLQKPQVGSLDPQIFQDSHRNPEISQGVSAAAAELDLVPSPEPSVQKDVGKTNSQSFVGNTDIPVGTDNNVDAKYSKTTAWSDNGSTVCALPTMPLCPPPEHAASDQNASPNAIQMLKTYPEDGIYGCNTESELTVFGSHLSVNPADYHIAGSPGTALVEGYKASSKKEDQNNYAQVRLLFTGLHIADQVGNYLSLTMTGDHGIGTAKVKVLPSGACKAVKAPAKANPKVSAPPVVTLSFPSGLPLDLCRLPPPL
jgi:hypothetical protein